MRTTNKLLGFVLFLAFLAGCKKSVSINEVLTDFTVDKTEIIADGNTAVTLTVKLNSEANADRRNIIFTTSNGSFGNGAKKTVKAEYIDGVLMAKTSFKVSTKPGEITVSVKPEFDSPYDEYRLEKKITANLSIAQSIKLEPSSFGMATNFASEINLIGYLKNTNGGFVSSGYKVLFEDQLQSGGAANGRFRKVISSTTDSSKVSAIYAAPALPIGTNIRIRCTVLDDAGNPTNISDNIILTINL